MKLGIVITPILLMYVVLSSFFDSKVYLAGRMDSVFCMYNSVINMLANKRIYLKSRLIFVFSFNIERNNYIKRTAREQSQSFIRVRSLDRKYSLSQRVNQPMSDNSRISSNPAIDKYICPVTLVCVPVYLPVIMTNDSVILELMKICDN